MIISREYEEFLKEEVLKRKLSYYEKACKYSEKILPIEPPKSLGDQLNSAIEFSNLKVTPRGVFSLTILAGIVLFFFPLLLLGFSGSFSFSSVIFIFILVAVAIYFLINYPARHATTFRIKASSEMVLATIYMSISMHLSPNLENAIGFAAKNLKGPLGRDLIDLLWGIFTRKYDSISQALDIFITKWKEGSKEFSEALYIIKNSIFESAEKREKMLDEAVSVILEGTKTRMRQYSRELKPPLTVLNAMGILLPIIGLVFFPILTIFLPELIRPAVLIVGYDVFLPLFVYFFMNNYLAKRPYSFSQPDLSKHPEFLREKLIEKPYFIPLLVSIPLIIFGSHQIMGIKEVFSFSQLAYSILIILGVILGILSYSYLSVKRKLKVRDEIVAIESEFTEALFQLGQIVTRGMPLENALRKVTQDIKNLTISNFFEKILYNIEILGMSFEQAVFSEKSGAMNYYPSSLIEATMRVIIEASKRGMASASKAMLTVSTYLKDMYQVNEELKDLTEEVTSTMRIQAMLLAPLSAGIVVSLTAVIIQILVSLGKSFESVSSQLGTSYGVAGDIGGGFIFSIGNLNKIIPISAFQLVVGIYMVEIVTMLAIFLSSIANGEESFMKRLTIAKLLAISSVIYFLTFFITYYMFTAIIPISSLIIT
jgi:hypothetical protein